MSRDLPDHIVEIFASAGIAADDIPSTPTAMAEMISDAILAGTDELHTGRSACDQAGNCSARR